MFLAPFILPLFLGSAQAQDLPSPSEPAPLPPDLASTNEAPPSTGRKILYGVEGVGNFFLVQFTSTAIHECVHWGVLKAWGIPVEGLNLIPFQQQVIVTDEVFAGLSNAELFTVAMAPQVWDPLSAPLPMWIHSPPDDSWWLRVSSMYYLFNLMFQGSAVVAMSWVEFAGGEDPQKDVGVAAAALTDSRAGQAAFYGGATLLLGTNIVLRWPHISQAWRIVTRKDDTWTLPDRGNGVHAAIGPYPGGGMAVGVTGTF